MSLAAQNWQQWVQDFRHGRTHVAYGLIASTLAAGAGVVMSPSLADRILFLVGLVGSLGGLVDTVAHLYYH